VLKMLIMGITITAAVNMLLWRSSARKTLRTSMSSAVVSLGDLLAMITGGFLAGSEEDLVSREFSQIVDKYSAANATMHSALRESKFEYYFLGREKQYVAAKAIVASVDKLSQALGGLRSACDAQFILLKE